MNTPNIKDLSPSRCREIYIKTNYSGFWKYLNENYYFLESFQERMYWYYNKLDKKPVCGNCGGPVRFVRFSTGYQEYCCKKCANNSAKKIEDIKLTNNAKFGGNAPACSSEVQNKMKSTCVVRYGVENAMQNSEIKKKTRDTHVERYGGQGNGSKILLEKQKKTCLERYGVDNYAKSADYASKHDAIQAKTMQTNLNLYGVKSYSQSTTYKNRYEEIRNKVNATKREHKTFNSSNIEQLIIAYLDEHHILYKHEYRSELYPFNCDFYFPDKDLYVEINAMWTHGSHPYDCTNKEDQEEVQLWKSKSTKFYENAINTWTIRDVRKREFAKKNGLNYLEIFSNDANEVLEQLLPKLQ